MEIYLIRHTAVQAPGICYGHYDVPLADTFATEAAQLRTKLPPPPRGIKQPRPALPSLS